LQFNTTNLLAIYLVTINLIAFIVYRFDKYQARKKRQRIAEKALLCLAAV